MRYLKQSLWSLVVIGMLASCSSENENGTSNRFGGDGSPTIQEGTSVGNGFYLSMMANLVDAESLTTTKPTESDPGRKLVKQTSDKKFSDVLTGAHQILFWKQTPTHVIAQVRIVEGNQKCHLIAIPKRQEISKVLCLSRDSLIMGDEVEINSTTHEAKRRPQFDVRGSEVYFTHARCLKTDIPYHESSAYCYQGNVATELRHWDGVSEKVETLIYFDREHDQMADIYQPFTSEANGNLCFATRPGYENTYGISIPNRNYGMVYCYHGESRKWAHQQMPLDSVRAYDYSNSENAIKINNQLVTEHYTINLANLEYKKNRNELPDVIDYPLENGGLVGRSGGEIIRVDSTGKGEVIFNTNRDATTLVRQKDFAWFYSYQTLRKVSLKDGTLDPVDYFKAADLIQISKISGVFTPFGEQLVLQGTANSEGRGIPATRHLSPEGELMSASSMSIPVDHPIELRWNP